MNEAKRWSITKIKKINMFNNFMISLETLLFGLILEEAFKYFYVEENPNFANYLNGMIYLLLLLPNSASIIESLQNKKIINRYLKGPKSNQETEENTKCM